MMIKSDFPEELPGLVDVVKTQLASNEPTRILAALLAGRYVVRKYEMQ